MTYPDIDDICDICEGVDDDYVPIRRLLRKSRISRIVINREHEPSLAPPVVEEAENKDDLVFVDDVRINGDDPYIWVDFVMESSKVFKSYDELIKFFTTNYPRVLAQVETGDGYFLKKDSVEDLHNIASRGKILTYTFSYVETKCTEEKDTNGMILNIKKNDDIKKIKLSFLLEDLREVFPPYSRIVFKPRDYKIKKYDFNTWTEFVGCVKPIGPKGPKGLINMDVVNPILDFIKDIISNNEDDSYRYILSWLRHICKTPWDNTGVALFFFSPQGCGKGSFISFLMNHVFGVNCTAAVTGLDQLTQKHNKILMNKILISIDELPTTSKEFHGAFDRMKHLITEKKISIEPKGKESFCVDNCCNYMLSTNNIRSLKIEKSDRRYAVFSLNNKHAKDHKYWDKIHSNVLTEKAGVEFYRYLVSDIDKDQYVSVRNIPTNKTKMEIQEMSKSGIEAFMEQIKTGEITIPDQYFMKEFDLPMLGKTVKRGITSANIYRIYEEWRKERGEKEISQRNLVTGIKATNISEYRKSKIDKKVIRYFDLTGFLE